MKEAQQKIFDDTWAAYITRKEPWGFEPECSSCSYYTHDGYRCAIGRLLTEEQAKALPQDASRVCWFKRACPASSSIRLESSS